MKTVNEVSKITGVSVRTLHYYDAIGLLKPTALTDAGYRLYDDTAISRLQSILLFRELQFPLKQIKLILDNPDFDQKKALRQQIELLEMQQRHIQQLISHAREIQEKGEFKMSFDVFDKSEIERYRAEAKEKWGATAQYREFEKKERSGADFGRTTDGMMDIFSRFGALRDDRPNGAEVQNEVQRLRNYITENCYNCSVQTLKSLADMYTADERFRKNIDRAGGEGTAEFVKKAIYIYCACTEEDE